MKVYKTFVNFHKFGFEVQSHIFNQTPPFKEKHSWTLDPDEGGLLKFFSMDSFNKNDVQIVYLPIRETKAVFFGLERCNI